MSIEIENVNKRFGDFVAVDNVNLLLPEGQLTALLGPSGSGKTTLLRIIAGLERPDSGRLRFSGVDVSDVHVSERGVGFVFQHYALFRHMTVFDNVAYGLTVRPRRLRPDAAEIRRRVMRLLELVQLEHTANRLPSQLSGGQRQRIALARALAVEPKVLLLDEPFGALDAKVRAELRRWLRRLHDEIHVTSVFVTHDQDEALEVADQVVVMNAGAVEQMGPPEEVYDHPATSFVTQFLGQVNRFEARVEAGRARVGNVELPVPVAQPAQAGSATADTTQSQASLPLAGLAFVRPHEFEVLSLPHADALEAQLDLAAIVGPDVRLELSSAHSEQPLQVVLPRHRYRELGLAIGDTVWLRPLHGRVFLQDVTLNSLAA